MKKKTTWPDTIKEILLKYVSNVSMTGSKMHVVVRKRHPSNRKLQDKTRTRDSK